MGADRNGQISDVTTDRNAAGDAPAIDLDTLENLARDAGAEAMPALIASFIRDCGRREAEITAAVMAKDLIALEAQTHAMTSSAQTFGALALADLTRAIENDCRNGWAEDALSRATILSDVSTAARQAMEAHRVRFSANAPDE